MALFGSLWLKERSKRIGAERAIVAMKAGLYEVINYD